MNRKQWEELVTSSNLCTPAFAVGMALGTFGNWTKDKTVEPGMQRLADMTGLSRDTVKSYIDEFVDQGWLTPVRRGVYNTTIYELTKPSAAPTGKLAKPVRKISDKQKANLKPYQSDPVAEAFCNLRAKHLQKRSATKLQIVSATKDESVAETKDSSCRNEQVQLQKPADSVAEPLCMNHINNLYEPDKQPSTSLTDVRLVEESTNDPSSASSEALPASGGGSHSSLTNSSTIPHQEVAPQRVHSPKYNEGKDWLFLDSDERAFFTQIHEDYPATEEQMVEAINLYRHGNFKCYGWRDKAEQAAQAAGIDLGDEW